MENINPEEVVDKKKVVFYVLVASIIQWGWLAFLIFVIFPLSTGFWLFVISCVTPGSDFMWNIPWRELYEKVVCVATSAGLLASPYFAYKFWKATFLKLPLFNTRVVVDRPIQLKLFTATVVGIHMISHFLNYVFNHKIPFSTEKISLFLQFLLQPPQFIILTSIFLFICLRFRWFSLRIEKMTY